jgi:hypothetical protein
MISPHITPGVFLGEAAQMMVQNVDYEIPFLRKQIARMDQQIADCDRKHAEFVKSSKQCAASFEKVRLEEVWAKGGCVCGYTHHNWLNRYALPLDLA